MCNFRPFLNLNNDRELTFNNIRDFLKREHKSRPHIFLSGGEPFLRSDIFDIIKEIKTYKLTCGICTNGTLLDKDKISRIIRLKAEYLIFSLHGPSDIHDKITGVSGSFNKLCENIVCLRSMSKKVKIFLNCAITEMNLSYLEDTACIAEKLKVDALRFEHLNFLTVQEVIKHNKICKKYFPYDKICLCSNFINIDNNNLYYEYIMKMKKASLRFKVPIHFKPFLNDSEIKTWYSNEFKIHRKCYFIWRSLFISPSGDVIPCQFIIYKLGNIIADGLEEIWNSEKYREFRLKLKTSLLPGCSRCCKL